MWSAAGRSGSRFLRKVPPAKPNRSAVFSFFAANGCGDYCCYRVGPDGTAICILEHEDLGGPCCWKRAAASMAGFITKYYHNKI